MSTYNRTRRSLLDTIRGNASAASPYADELRAHLSMVERDLADGCPSNTSGARLEWEAETVREELRRIGSHP